MKLSANPSNKVTVFNHTVSLNQQAMDCDGEYNNNMHACTTTNYKLDLKFTSHDQGPANQPSDVLLVMGSLYITIERKLFMGE